MDYNGMKLVRENARPISADTGLKDIQALAESGTFTKLSKKVQLKTIIFCQSLSITY
jgi:phosphomannomutase